MLSYASLWTGSAGEGVVAKFSGKVSLTCGSKKISKKHISQELLRAVATIAAIFDLCDQFCVMRFLRIRQDHLAVSEWKRSPQGDVGCVLAKASISISTSQIAVQMPTWQACVLEIEADGKSQTEELEPGCYVIVLDGAWVFSAALISSSSGQFLQR